MAITTQLVGKLGGGLSWTKVAGVQKSIAWNATSADQVLASTTLGAGKRYLLAMKYTYISGNPANCAFEIKERGTSAGSNTWAILGPYSITTGTRQYQLMVSNQLTSASIAEIRFIPGYQSGTHVLSADLYYAEMPAI